MESLISNLPIIAAVGIVATGGYLYKAGTCSSKKRYVIFKSKKYSTYNKQKILFTIFILIFINPYLILL